MLWPSDPGRRFRDRSLYAKKKRSRQERASQNIAATGGRHESLDLDRLIRPRCLTPAALH